MNVSEDLVQAKTYSLPVQLVLTIRFDCMQSPPPLDAPLQCIGKDPDAKEIGWEDDGVLVHSMDLDVF